ncbi:hypothetical protein AVEN_65989-1 [Araneus ventricosus]|uniref:Retrovirus-related Pol polyprotein from transposon TNT 1-94 n=1 Tax=Araneus ventricosus TaxID=182803 RepID=A0A4Y2QP20_ARAVE|nr:hypothetical protein AVEN_65989-1 [Araneus ventricosus]
MEAEYVTLTEAAKELIWIKNVLNNECLNLKDCLLYCDNQAAIGFSNSPFENQRTKHIDVKYHFLRNLVYDKIPLTLLMVALLSLQRHLMMRKANTADANPGCSPLMSSPQSTKTYSEKASSSTEASPDPYVTRSGRTVRPPEKLDL